MTTSRKSVEFHRGDILWIQCDPSVGVEPQMIMTYDRRRVVKLAGRISADTQRALNQALSIHLDLVPV